MASLKGIRLRVDTRDLQRFGIKFERAAANQIPFAIARALTDVAKDSKLSLKRTFGRHFKLRNKALPNRAIAVQNAKKRDKPITAWVGTRPFADFLTLQVTGGTKRGKGGSRVAIPTRIVKRTATGRVKKRQKPRVLRDRKGFQPQELAEKQRITVRAARKRKDRRSNVGIFFLVRQRVRIKKRWPFRRIVHRTANIRLGPAFALRFEQALRTAK